VAKTEPNPKPVAPLIVGVSIPTAYGEPVEARARHDQDDGPMLGLYANEPLRDGDVVGGVRFRLRELAEFNGQGITLLASICAKLLETTDGKDPST